MFSGARRDVHEKAGLLDCLLILKNTVTLFVDEKKGSRTTTKDED